MIFLGIGSWGHHTCATKTLFFLIFLWRRETIPVLLKPSQTITQCSYHPRVLPGLGSMASLLLLAFLCKECWDPAIFLSNGTLVFNLLGRTMQNFNARNWEPSNPLVYMFFLACLVSSGQYYNHSLLKCTSWDGIPILSSKYLHVHSHHCYPNDCHVCKWCFNLTPSRKCEHAREPQKYSYVHIRDSSLKSQTSSEPASYIQFSSSWPMAACVLIWLQELYQSEILPQPS